MCDKGCVCERLCVTTIVCERLCVKDCVTKIVCDKLGGGGGGGGADRIQNQKQEPHTKMWGKTFYVTASGFVGFSCFRLVYLLIHH